MRFLSLEAGHDRKFGLDLLRFFAIIYVVLGHSKILLPERFDFYIGKIILDGVSIFFVLSGFLIGRILLKMIQDKRFGARDLWNFWSRRWMRTLPAYFLVLSFLIFYTWALKPARLPEDWYRYFLFTQNFFVPQPPFFSESWSLSIEEWFYLLIPLLFFSLAALFPKQRLKLILIFIFVVIAAVLAYRCFLFNRLGLASEKNVDLYITRQVLCRLDAIMFGVLGAYASLHLPNWWAKWNHWWIFVLCFVMLYVLKENNSNGQSIYSAAVMPGIKSFFVLLMLPYLSELRTNKPNILLRFVTFTSVISYSMYLLNRTVVIDIFIKYGLYDNLKSKHFPEQYWVLDYLLFLVLSYALSFLLYKVVERPFLKLRDKISR